MKRLIPWLLAGVVGLAYWATSDAANLEHCWESRSNAMPKVRMFFNHPCKYRNMNGGSVAVVDDSGYVIKGCSIYSPSQRVFIVDYPEYNTSVFFSIDDFDYSMECVWRDDY